jgi:hypothetical protein
MALQSFRIGPYAGIQYNDSDFDTAIETTQPIAAGAPVSNDHVVRLGDTVSLIAQAVEAADALPTPTDNDVFPIVDVVLHDLMKITVGEVKTLLETYFNDLYAAIDVNGNLLLPKTSGIGIKVDLATPTFGWKDLLGEIKILSPGANDPTLAVFRDSVRAFSFSNAVVNEVHLHYHIPHDYLPGSDIFIHFHWSQNVVDTGGPAGVPGDVKWQAEVTYAKGHNQAAFPASFTTSVVQTASGTQYRHMLAEVQLSAASPSATQIDSDILEPDGLIIVRGFRNPADGADTLNQVPFLHFVDIHYQSTGLATKQKAPDFYT